MQKIIAIIWKDILIRFSNKAEWLFFLILPIAFTVILAGGTGPSTDNRIRLIVVDQANSPLSVQFITVLNQSATVRPDVVSLSKAESEFSQRRASAMLVIPVGFDTNQVADGAAELELRQLPNDINAVAAYQGVQAALRQISSSVEIASATVTQAARIKPSLTAFERKNLFAVSLQAAQEQLATAPERVQEIAGATQDQVEYDPRANSSAGQLITWVFIPLIGISAMFAYERQRGTLRRLLTTPTRKATYLLGTITSQGLIALVQMLLLVIFGILVMKVNWGHDPAALAVILVASILAAAALGTTLGTFVKTEGQANGLSIMLGMVMALLGGCWYPIELFPQFVRTAVKVLPTTWAMQGMLDIVLRGQGMAAVLPVAGVLLGFAAIFFVIGVWRFRYE